MKEINMAGDTADNNKAGPGPGNSKESKPDKRLPEFTKGEEIFNAVSHITGGAFGIFALVFGIIFACLYGDGITVVSMAVYGASMVLLYTMSSIYHFLRPNKAKRVFRILDHCMIYLLIAGTYTPYCLITLRGLPAGWIIFGFVWGFSALGITLNAINMHSKSVKIFSYISYIALGWCVVFAFKTIVENLPAPALWLLLAGGILYTAGFVFYALDKKIKYSHGIWHLFVLAGSVLHFISIVLVLLP